jgi:hypothetical protein
MINSKRFLISMLGLLFIALGMFWSTGFAILLSLTVPASAYGDNRPPVAFDQRVVFATDQYVFITLTGDDPDGDRLSLFSVETPPEHLFPSGGTAGAVSCAYQGECLWIPPSGFTGTDSLTFTVQSCHDDSGICTTSAPATISIDIVESIPGPVAFSQDITVIQGTAVRINLTGNDPEGDPLTYAVTSGPTNGQLVLVYGPSGNGEFTATYTPDPGLIGQDEFLFAASDATTTSAPAAITVNLVSASAIVSSLLPTSRSVQVGMAATAFATIINTDTDKEAMGCSIAPPTEVPAGFSYQTTNSATNERVGTPDTPANIPAGGLQTFVFTLTPSVAIAPTDLRLSYDCTNTSAAAVVPGLNTLLLSSSSFPVPDILAVAATLAGDGIANIPGAYGANAFAVATVNLGSQDTITASADTGTAPLPVSLRLCQSDPATAECLSPEAGSVTTLMDTGATATFSIFVQGEGTMPFLPASNRIFVRFRDSDGVTRGSTSVAVRTQ